MKLQYPQNYIFTLQLSWNLKNHIYQQVYTYIKTLACIALEIKISIKAWSSSTLMWSCHKHKTQRTKKNQTNPHHQSEAPETQIWKEGMGEQKNSLEYRDRWLVQGEDNKPLYPLEWVSYKKFRFICKKHLWVLCIEGLPACQAVSYYNNKRHLIELYVTWT